MLLDLITTLDDLLGTDSHFLLGPWIEDAKAFGTTPREIVQYEQNARNQITMWGPSGQILDYANKQWSGLVKDYYLRRWQLFLDTLQGCLKNNKSFNQGDFNTKVLKEVEMPFTYATKSYPVKPVGKYERPKGQFDIILIVNICRVSINSDIEVIAIKVHLHWVGCSLRMATVNLVSTYIASWL